MLLSVYHRPPRPSGMVGKTHARRCTFAWSLLFLIPSPLPMASIESWFPPARIGAPRLHPFIVLLFRPVRRRQRAPSAGTLARTTKSASPCSSSAPSWPAGSVRPAQQCCSSVYHPGQCLAQEQSTPHGVLHLPRRQHGLACLAYPGDPPLCSWGFQPWRPLPGPSISCPS